MILKIAGDIQFFLLVLATVLIGFAQAFYVISYGDSSLDFGRIDSVSYIIGRRGGLPSSVPHVPLTAITLPHC